MLLQSIGVVLGVPLSNEMVLREKVLCDSSIDHTKTTCNESATICHLSLGMRAFNFRKVRLQMNLCNAGKLNIR